MSIPQQHGYGPPPLPATTPPPPRRRVPWTVFAVVCLVLVGSMVGLTLYTTGMFDGEVPQSKTDPAEDVPPNPYSDPEETPYGYVADLCERLDWSKLGEILEFTDEHVAAEYKPDSFGSEMKCGVDGTDTNAGEAGVSFNLGSYSKPKNAKDMYEHIDVGDDEDGSRPLPDVQRGTIQVHPAAAEGRTGIAYSLVDGNLIMRGMTVVLDEDAADAEEAVLTMIADILTTSKEV